MFSSLNLNLIVNVNLFSVEAPAHPHLTQAAIGASAGHYQEYDVYDEAGSYLGLLGSNGHYTAAASAPHEAYSQYDGYY